MGLPPNAVILMTAAYGARRNVWKDYETLHDALIFLGRAWDGRDLLMLIVGGREKAGVGVAPGPGSCGTRAGTWSPTTT